MQSAEPPVKAADVARACHVTPQAVNGWLKTGTLQKRHLPVLARLTGRPLAYFLEEDSTAAVAREPEAAAYGARQLTAKQEILLYLFDGLVPEQQRESIDRMKATFETNQALARQMGGKPLRFVSNSAIEGAFGSVEQLRARKKVVAKKAPRRESGTAMDDFLEDPE